MTDITVETLRELLDHDPATGELTWKVRDPKWFKGRRYTAQDQANAWNAKKAGKPALTAVNNKGYKTGGIFRKPYKAHRVIWAMATGAWPESQIDHINGIRDDNRIENLRDVTNQENSRNRKLRNDNTSGHIGVSWDKQENKWRAFIHVNGKKKHLGFFIDKADAIAARKAAEIEHGFHSNHGRAAA